MYEQKHGEANNIQEDMEVEAAKGDLGEEDVSKPQVKKVVRGPDGNVEKIVIHKGVLFQKELEIPADRVQRVEPAIGGETNGKVIIDSNEKELESLKAAGKETLPPEEVIMSLIGLDPIKLLFWANILQGVLAPILVILLIILGNNRKIMHDQPLSWITNLGLILTTIVMIAAAILLFYGLATGQSS